MQIEDQTVRDHADRILAAPEIQSTISDTKARVQKIIAAIFDDPKIKTEFNDARIRYTAMCGNVIRAVLDRIGENPEQIQFLSIGDVILPEFARETINQILEFAHRCHMESIKGGETGYDVAAKGSEMARRALIHYFDDYYGFSKVSGLKEQLVKNTCLTNGGMNAIDHITTGLVRRTVAAGKQHVSIQPDNSFGTWFAIAGMRSLAPHRLHTIPVKQKNLLHILLEDVEDFYAMHPHEHEENINHTWYITPVGNPSGTVIDPNQLANVCDAIVDNDPESVIVLDCVYIRTLPQEKARELMEGVIQNPSVRERVIFIESFSKTHGICGERVGAYFSANDELFTAVQNVTMILTAGMSKQVDALAYALATASSEQNAVIKQLHEFWALERNGLYNFLIKSNEFKDLFDEDQSHITPNDIENSAGLYIFLRLKPGVNFRQVLLRTGCLGVETPMGPKENPDIYIRFSVGKLTQPTYAKYAKKVAVTG